MSSPRRRRNVGIIGYLYGDSTHYANRRYRRRARC
jgi:hypothetical protein